MTDLHSTSLERATGPLVTIAIPTFNRADWLNDCVRTAFAQTYRNFEVLVSDNASTDDTPAVLKQFSDPRLRVVRQPENIGSTGNWNACLANARGEYTVFVPDDDRISPWLLERCVEVAERDPEIQIVMALGDAHVLAERRTLPALASRRIGTGVWEGTEILKEYLQARVSVQGCTTMMRTAAMRAAGGLAPDLPFANDLALQLPLLIGRKAGFVNEACGLYCIHEATETSNLRLETYLDDLRKLTKLLGDVAAQRIADAHLRDEITTLAQRFGAINSIGILASSRRLGATNAQLLPLIWQRRRDLIAGGPGNLLKMSEQTWPFLIPLPVIRALRRMRRALQR